MHNSKNIFMAPKVNLDKKELAKSLYIHGTFTLEEIAEKVGCARQTLTKWSKADNWEEVKASKTISPEQILAGFNRQIIEINKNIDSRPEGERFATTAEADTLVKLASAIKKIETDTGIADIVNVGIKFTNWLRPLDLDMAKKFSDLIDAYIKDQLK